MGTTLHARVEVEDSIRWVEVAVFHFGKNYGLMRDVSDVAEERDWPKDAWGRDAPQFDFPRGWCSGEDFMIALGVRPGPEGAAEMAAHGTLTALRASGYTTRVLFWEL